jgi:predicted RNA-binding protein YlqC (UPF0109 family)
MTEAQIQSGNRGVDGTRQLLERVLLTLVSIPDEVRIQVLTVDDTTTFAVRVAPLDVSRVLGDDGRTVRAMRMILGAVGLRQKHRFILEVEENSE